MTRTTFEDIKLNKPTIKKSPNEVKEKKQITLKKEDSSFNERKIQRTPQLKTKSKILSKHILILFIFSVLAGMVYWGMNIFQKVDITITPKLEVITYKNKQFSISKDLNKNINFEIMIVSDKKLINIILKDSKEVSIKSQGSITLYNEFSTSTEKLPAGTFISDNNGKTYKTNNTVIIPGYKISNKKIIPGQITVNITSFLAGEMYNGTPTDFYINSFKKGTVKYNKIYGKLNDPLVGGISGLVYILDDSNKNDINNIIQTSVKEDLFRQVKSLVPPGYILYPGATTFSNKTLNDIMSKTPESEIEIKATLSAVLLKEKNLMDFIIKTYLPNILEDEFKEIEISDLKNLSFSFINKDQLINKDTNIISFSLSGDMNAIWNPDIETLKTKLVGIHKNDVLSVFKKDPGIASALVKIFPPWQKYIPNDLSKINIIIK